jgi:hypothetical protein
LPLPHGFCPLFGNLKRLGCGHIGGGFLSLSFVLFAHDSLYLKRHIFEPSDFVSGCSCFSRRQQNNQLRITTQSATAHILDHCLLPCWGWGDSFALEINPDNIEEWPGALVLANPTREKIRRAINVVCKRWQKSRMLAMTEEGNSVAFVTQSSKSNYKAVIVRPEQAFRIMMELEDPHRTVVFLVAVTGLRISEALGLKWGDLDYRRQMIHLLRVWGSALDSNLVKDSDSITFAIALRRFWLAAQGR